MIAIDTNVLLRYLLEDDAEQSSKANLLMTNKGEVLVTDVVLVEAIWTLRGKKYQLNKSELVNVIQTLFQEPNIRFENGQAVWLALNDYRNSKRVKGKEADFADALIVNKARYVADNQGYSFAGSYTFDRAAQKIPGAKAP
jgi:predicted nucleic-acid-binding protein